MNNKKMVLAGIFLLCLALPNFASAVLVEKRIQSGEIATADLIVPEHPRILIKGDWDWDYKNKGSFAWRILHGKMRKWPWGLSPANDQEKFEFAYSAGANDSDSYGADNMYKNFGHDFSFRPLEPIISGKAQKLKWKKIFGPGYELDHTADEYFEHAREKLMNLVNHKPRYEAPYIAALYGSAAYDWLVSERYTNGNPVLSENDKAFVRKHLIKYADYLKSLSPEKGNFFDATNTDNFYYVVAGLALYEPSRKNDPSYASINKKAKSYLDAFDKDFIGKVLPALNAQGGDGGWHGGLSNLEGSYMVGGSYGSKLNPVPLLMAPILFAHYTATGQSIENSLFSTGVLKYFVEFQMHMILPSAIQINEGPGYFEIGGPVDRWNRIAWIFPMRAYSRRRFSEDPEQRKLGELGAWIRTSYGKGFTDHGSWCMLDQLLFEDKWINPRNPEKIGFTTTRHFKKLGWVFMRSGFTSEKDLASLFTCQKFHWSHLNLYAQNSINLRRKGALIEGFKNTIYIDGKYQRSISKFPVVSKGVKAYAPGTTHDVGPGILDFHSNDTYDYVKGDATNAYSDKTLKKYTRQLVYLKPDIFIMFDRVITTNSSIEKKWVIDPAAEPKKHSDNIISISNGKGALWINRLLPENAKVKLSSSQIAVVPVQKTKETYFLHVMQAVNAGARFSKVSANKAILSQKENWFRVSVAGHQVGFNRNGDFEFDGTLSTTE